MTLRSEGHLNIESFQGSEAVWLRTDGWLELQTPTGDEPVLLSKEGAVGPLSAGTAAGTSQLRSEQCEQMCIHGS